MTGRPRLSRTSRIIRTLTGAGRLRPGTVNHVSLGTVCHTAGALRDCGLRRWAGPFDWLFSTPTLVTDCIRDDFATLLDPALLRSVPPEALTDGSRRQCRHPTYEARYGVPILFNHHDPAGSAADRVSLARAVARLRTALREPYRNILYVTSVDYEIPDTDVAALAEVLAPLASRNALVATTLRSDRPEGRSAREERQDIAGVPILRFDLGFGSAWRALRFADPADDAHLAEAWLSTEAKLSAAMAPARGGLATGAPEDGLASHGDGR